jgi:hypothetical protein
LDCLDVFVADFFAFFLFADCLFRALPLATPRDFFDDFLEEADGLLSAPPRELPVDLLEGVDVFFFFFFFFFFLAALRELLADFFEGVDAFFCLPPCLVRCFVDLSLLCLPAL